MKMGESNLEIIKQVINNLDDIELIKRICKLDRYSIMNINAMFEKNNMDTYLGMNIDLNDIKKYLNLVVDCKDKDKRLSMILFLQNNRDFSKYSKSEIYDMLLSVVVEDTNNMKDNSDVNSTFVKTSPVFSDLLEKVKKVSDMAKDAEETNSRCKNYDLTEYKKLSNIRNLHGDIYTQRLMEKRLLIMSLLKKNADIKSVLLEQMNNVINSIYNLEQINSLYRSLNNDKLMKDREPEEIYIIIYSFAFFGDLYELLDKLFNSENTLKNRSFKDMVKILDELARGDQLDKAVPQDILLNDLLLENRTGDETIKLYYELLKCHNYEEAHIFKSLILAPNLDKINFENQSKEIEIVRSATDLGCKQSLAYLFNQLNYNNHIDCQDKLALVNRAKECFDDTSRLDDYATYIIRTTTQSDIPISKVFEIANMFNKDDTPFEVSCRAKIINDCVGDWKDANFDMSLIESKMQGNTLCYGKDAIEAQELLSLLNKIKNANSVYEVRSNGTTLKS